MTSLRPETQLKMNIRIHEVIGYFFYYGRPDENLNVLTSCDNSSILSTVSLYFKPLKVIEDNQQTLIILR